MKEWNVLFIRQGQCEESFIVLPSFRKLLFWFVRTAWQCNDIKIFVS